MIFNCSSASRIPTQRWMPKPNETMGARPGAVDDEFVGTLDHLFVAVARDVPHHHLVALFDLLAAELEVLERGAAHMRQRRLPADHLRHEAVDQSRDCRAACGTDPDSWLSA